MNSEIENVIKVILYPLHFAQKLNSISTVSALYCSSGSPDRELSSLIPMHLLWALTDSLKSHSPEELVEPDAVPEVGVGDGLAPAAPPVLGVEGAGVVHPHVVHRHRPRPPPASHPPAASRSPGPV